MRSPSLALALLITSIPAQDRPDPTSGPAPGSETPAFTVFAPTGTDAGLEFDIAKLFGDGPGAVLVVHELTRNVAPLVRGLDRIGDTHALLGLEVVTVLLAADRNEIERRATAASRSLGSTRPMTVSVDGAEGPGAWALDRRAAATFVVCGGGDVKSRLRLTDTNPDDVERLRAAIEKVTGPMPKEPAKRRQAALDSMPQDPAALRLRAARLALHLNWRAQMDQDIEERRNRNRDRGRMRETGGRGRTTDRPMNERGRGSTDGTQPKPQRVGKAPEDTRLQTLLRSIIRKDAPTERIDQLFADVDARVGTDKGLEKQAIEMFRLVLSLDYGNAESRKRATAWLKAHGGQVPPAKKPAGDGGRDTKRRDR